VGRLKFYPRPFYFEAVEKSFSRPFLFQTKEAKNHAYKVVTKEELESIISDKKKIKKLADSYDRFLCEASLMAQVGKHLGAILGPRGKVPKPMPPRTNPEPFIKMAKRTIRISLRDNPVIHISVGTEDHSCFTAKGFERLNIEDIYRLATAILFPSETEGRGLPIVESSAAGIPIICSRYFPEEVFAGVVGEGLPEEKQIKYTLFPEDGFPESFLEEVTALLLNPQSNQSRIEHNKNATRQRYSTEVIFKTFKELLNILAAAE